MWETSSLYQLVCCFRYDWIRKSLMFSWGCLTFLICFITTSLRYNSHTLQFSHLKCIIQWSYNVVTSCATMTTVNLRTLSLPQKETLYLLSIHISFSPNASQPRVTTNLLSISMICLLVIYYKWIYIISGLSWVAS